MWHFKEKPSPPARLDYSESEMCALPWRRIVLYDVELGLDHPQAALVAYDVEGGLHPMHGQGEVASHARTHFGFLAKDWDFKLGRHMSKSGRSGCLHLDGRGGQRMEMLGIHDWRRNKHQPPDMKLDRALQVANPTAALDAYVVHMDSPAQFGGAVLKPIWNAISERMHALMPAAMGELAKQLAERGVRDNLRTTVGAEVVSDDLIVNNVGVSSEYQSPPHFDVNDVGWTCAFALKCGPRMGSHQSHAYGLRSKGKGSQ